MTFPIPTSRWRPLLACVASVATGLLVIVGTTSSAPVSAADALPCAPVSSSPSTTAVPVVATPVATTPAAASTAPTAPPGPGSSPTAAVPEPSATASPLVTLGPVPTTPTTPSCDQVPPTPSSTASPPTGVPPVTPPPVDPRTVVGPLDQTVADVRIAAKLGARAVSLGLGSRTGVLVRDTASGRDVAAIRAAQPLMPASTAKLATAVTALSVLGPQHQFVTRTVTTARRDVIVLLGGGDPSLTRANLDLLATQTAQDLLSRRVPSVQLQADDSLFPAPTNANGWPRGTVPSQVSAIRALVVDQHRSRDTTLDAAKVFSVLLARHGVRVTRVARHVRPRGTRVMGTVQGATLDTIVRTMLLTSDNDIAEVLARQVALAAGVRPTWSATSRVRATLLSQLGVPMAGVHLYDGSGLSRRDRVTAAALVSMLALAADGRQVQLHDVVFGGDLPQAGVTGSLRTARGRFVTAPSRCAAGMLWAKTGQLHDVTSLAGVTYGADGRLKAFAIMVNGPKSSLAMRRKVDALAATVTGCW